MENNEFSNSRLEYIRSLNSGTRSLSISRIEECKASVLEAYESATVIPHVADVTMVYSKPYTLVGRFKSIGLREKIDKSKFTASNYSWKYYFSQVGRAIAYGEQRYLQKIIVRRIRPSYLKISISNPDFSVIGNAISVLRRTDIKPDTIIMPSQLVNKFTEYYFLSEESIYKKYTDDLNDGYYNFNGHKLKLFWTNKYCRLNSVLIFNSHAGVWKILQDSDFGDSQIVIAIGESLSDHAYVEYWVETRALYQIKEPRSFIRINLSRDNPNT